MTKSTEQKADRMEVVSVFMPSTIIKMLDGLASSRRVTRSEMIRKAIKHYLTKAVENESLA